MVLVLESAVGIFFSIDAALPGLALSCFTFTLATTLLDRYAPSLA